MELSLQALNNITSPLEIAHLLNKELVKTDDGYNTTCPVCAQKMMIGEHDFICSSDLCTFRSGSFVDFIVASEKIPWENIIDSLDTILDGRLNGTSILRDKKDITKYLKAKRKLIEFFIRISLYGSDNNITCLQYKNLLRGQGIDPDITRASLHIIGNDDSIVLSNILNSLGVQIKLSGTNIILPYYSNYSTIANLILLRSPQSKPERITVHASRLSYFGLPSLDIYKNKIRLAYTYSEAAKLNTSYERVSPELKALHFLYDAKASGHYLDLPYSVYVITSGSNDNFRAVAMLQKYVKELKVDLRSVDFYNPNPEISAEDYLSTDIINKIKEDKPYIQDLSIIELSSATKETLLSKLHSERYFDAAEEIRKLFRTLPLLSDDKHTLLFSPAGYSLRKNLDSSAPEIPASNFYIELKENVVFTESLDIFHSGEMFLNGREYPILLKSDDIEKSSDLEKAVRAACVGVYSQDAGEGIPTIKEKVLMRLLTPYLKQKISELPKLEGVPMLGWSPRKTSFFSPYFIADRKGIRSGKKIFHPNIPALKLFSNDIQNINILHNNLPEDIINVISQCATFIVRSYLGMPLKAIPVYNDTEARTLFRKLFQGLGQSSAYQLNHNIRGEENPGVRGYPFYSAGHTFVQANKCSLSSFNLCDAGLKITETYDAYTIEKAAQTLRYVVQKVVEWSIQTEAEVFSQVDSVSRARAYAAEGSSIIANACNIESWPEVRSKVANIDRFLSSIKYGDIEKYFTRDINRHVVQIDRTVIDNSGYGESIIDDLKLISKCIQNRESYIDVDSESMLDALSSYYHAEPNMPELFDINKFNK